MLGYSVTPTVSVALHPKSDVKDATCVAHVSELCSSFGTASVLEPREVEAP